jgi:hypothetical protein
MVQIVTMDKVTTIVTSTIIVITATFANMLTTDSFATTVIVGSIATMVTSAGFAFGANLANIVRTVASLHNRLFAIPGSIATMLTIERIGSNAIIAPDVAIGIFVHIGKIKRRLTLRTNGLTQLFQTTGTNRIAVNVLITITSDKILTFVTLGRLQIIPSKQTSLRNPHNPHLAVLFVVPVSI